MIEHHALALAEAANRTQPDAPELTPAQIEKKIADNACESCHVGYWYPDQQKVAKEHLHGRGIASAAGGLDILAL